MGSSEPIANTDLKRYSAGNRDFDVNIDGVAHYGLIPDFLQDLNNVGLKPEFLRPLFKSAEDYIKMWEKAVYRKDNPSQATYFTPVPKLNKISVIIDEIQSIDQNAMR